MRSEPRQDQRQVVRAAVRGLLEQNTDYRTLPTERRRQLAHDLVQLTETSLNLMQEEADVDPEAAQQMADAMGTGPPVAQMLEAPSDFNPAANRALAGVARDTLDGIAFPRFVTELVNGVFKGLIDANAQQIQAYVDMISGVTAASSDTGAATGADQARLWLVRTVLRELRAWHLDRRLGRRGRKWINGRPLARRQGWAKSRRCRVASGTAGRRGRRF